MTSTQPAMKPVTVTPTSAKPPDGDLGAVVDVGQVHVDAATATPVASVTGYEHLAPLFARLAQTDDPAERSRLRDELVTGYLPLAHNIGRRFSNRGQPVEDLVQVATVGLINAVDRFEAGRGPDFMSFAIPTIMGEVRRYFRDHSWAVRVPRRLKELHLSLTAATAELFQQLGRSPSPSELAAHLGISRDEVFEGLEAANAYSSLSIEAPQGGDGESNTVADQLGDEDPELEKIEFHEALAPLIKRLAPRERQILTLRFYGNLTQTQIAAKVGLSQMHVSRLLSRTLKQLRQDLETDG